MLDTLMPAGPRAILSFTTRDQFPTTKSRFNTHNQAGPAWRNGADGDALDAATHPLVFIRGQRKQDGELCTSGLLVCLLLATQTGPDLFPAAPARTIQPRGRYPQTRLSTLVASGQSYALFWPVEVPSRSTNYFFWA